MLGGSAFLTLTGAEPARDRLFVNGQAGRDRIDATAGASTPLLVVDGGARDDSISGTNADDVLNGGAGRDDVDPQRGNDVVGLGADDDTFLYSAGDGTDSVEGGTGRDGAFVSGSSANEELAVEAGGPRLRVRRNGAVGIDAGSVEALSVFSFGGADRLSVGDLTGTSLDTINASMFDFGVPGGNNDVVTVAGSAADDAIFVTGSGTNATVSGLQAKLSLTGLASDRLEVNAQGGKDTIDSTALAATPLAFRGDGGAGDDVVRGEQGDDVLDGGVGEDVLIGNAGADVLLNGEVVFDN